MPLIQDNSRGGGPGGGIGGGAKTEHRRSLADFKGIDKALLEMSQPAHSSKHHRDMNGNGDMEWLWKQPGSPEAAQTPRALVPSRCFPPRHSRDFASFSESARPGQSWSDDTGSSGQGLTDLVASLKALAIPEPTPRPRVQSYSQTIHLRLSCDKNLQGESVWPHDLNNSDAVNGRDEAKLVQRRASFCGVVPSSRHSKEAVSWQGSLPPRCPDLASGFSAKVFLGGLPWDITEQALMHTLRHFQPVRVEWPEREHTVGGSGCPRGFAYVTFESERRVRALLAASRRDVNDWYYRVQSRKMRSKEVQVIPWSVSDSSWVGCGSARLEPKRTVFVGALHGMLSAAALARIMDDLFAGVVYAGIDTDKNKYPIGSGRVTFNNLRSYIRAISAGYVEIHTNKFIKKVQVLPYLEDSMCSVCNLQQGPYFCREPTCYRYFCRTCWKWHHPNDEHIPLMRNSKSQPHFPHSHNGSISSRHSPPSDQSSVFNTGYNGNMEGTPSPPMSGSTYEPVTGSSSEEPDLLSPWANMQ